MDSSKEALKRWKLILGADPDEDESYSDEEQKIDKVLSALYKMEGKAGSKKKSFPRLMEWMDEAKQLFPKEVVQMMQKDIMDKVDLTKLIQNPEFFEDVEPDPELAVAMLSLEGSARMQALPLIKSLIDRLIEELQRRFQPKLQEISRQKKKQSMKISDPNRFRIDFKKTIRANINEFDPRTRMLIPKKFYGYQPSGAARRSLFLCVDQSASMGRSLLYAGVFGSVLATLPSTDTHWICFSTEVVDLTHRLDNPSELLLSVQLGGGTDIQRAVKYCRKKVRNPQRSTLILITDLFESGTGKELLQECKSLKFDGVEVIVLLALDEKGQPAYNAVLAEQLLQLGVSCRSCTPEDFPDFISPFL